MAERKRQVVEVNRAPVMTLWATVVAERLGHKHEGKSMEWFDRSRGNP